MNIIVESLSSVLIDDVNAGSVVDVLASRKEDLRVPLFDALRTWDESRVKLLTEDRDRCKARADELYAFVLKAEEALKNGASLEEVKSILDPLIEVEKTPEQQKRLKELQDQLDELNAKEADVQAEIDKINGPK